MMGTVVTTEAAWPALDDRCDTFGMTVSPDDAWLVLRGMRTLTARLAVHERSALLLAAWLQAQPEVVTVFCPALPGDPGNALWRRDCRGTNGLLSFELQPSLDDAAAVRIIDALELFSIGASWGGYESLVTLVDMQSARSIANWGNRGLVVRLSIGLEDPADLQADLAQAFGAMRTEQSRTAQP